jgi:hypothetical protein
MYRSRRTSHSLLDRIGLALALVLAPSLARAEEKPAQSPAEPKPRTSIVKSHVAQGGYVGPDAKLTSLAGSAALLVGAEAGWIIDHVLVLGGAAYTLVGDTPSPAVLQPPDGPSASLSLTYGGARVAIVPWAGQRLHLVFGVLGGVGRISSSSSSADYVSDSVVVIEPDAAFEASLAQSVRLAIGGSYRFTGGTGIASLGPLAVNGPTAFLTIKLGAF